MVIDPLENLAGLKFGNRKVVSWDAIRKRWLVRCKCGGGAYHSSSQIKMKVKAGPTKNITCSNCLKPKGQTLNEKYYKLVGRKVKGWLVKEILGFWANTSMPEFLVHCSCGKVKKCHAFKALSPCKKCSPPLKRILYESDIELIRDFLKAKLYSNYEIADMFSVSHFEIDKIQNTKPPKATPKQRSRK